MFVYTTLIHAIVEAGLVVSFVESEQQQQNPPGKPEEVKLGEETSELS